MKRSFDVRSQVPGTGFGDCSCDAFFSTNKGFLHFGIVFEGGSFFFASSSSVLIFRLNIDCGLNWTKKLNQK
jgi:hypothetical protein